MIGAVSGAERCGNDGRKTIRAAGYLVQTLHQPLIALGDFSPEHLTRF